MNVIVDTPIWSLAHRRRKAVANRHTEELADLIKEDRAVMIGSVRQEVLSGIRDELHFQRLRKALRALPDLVLETDDYESAARLGNKCRAHGIQGSATDFLLCAVSVRRGCAVFTTDGDFDHFARVLPIRLHQPRQ